jgi:hypothetical protein
VTEPSGTRAAFLATLAYAALTVVMTWPLFARLSSALPSDLADPALNSWALAWGSEHAARLARGRLDAFASFWDANIFHPSPLALAYSEHLLAQVLQIAPVYALTGDPVLCHNLLVLASFVLSGLGAFLLLRDLVGRGAPAPAFLGGLLFAFALYRFDQLPHLQVQSAQWMPFALFGLRRFVLTGRARPLVWGTLALLAQNLSCGYHLLFFPPFLAAFLLTEMARHGRLRSARTWAGLALAAGATLGATLPVLAPYAALREIEPTRRSRHEVGLLSAEVLSFAAAPEPLRLWGPLLTVGRRPEAALFPGLVPLGLAGIALGAAGARAHSAARSRALHASWPKAGALARGAAWLAALLLALAAASALGVGRLPRLSSLLLALAAALGLRAAASPRFREWLRGVAATPAFPLAVAAVLAAWLACGLSVRLAGREVGLPSAYAVLYEHVPGFDGVRVPARFNMVVVLFLSLLAGLGARELSRRQPGPRVLGPLAALFLAEAWVVPLPMNASRADDGIRDPGFVSVTRALPPVYGHVATLPKDAVLAELPFGQPWWEARYMLCSTRHWRRLVNGYSGYSPTVYPDGILGRVDRDPAQALETARRLGVSHLIVHEDAWYAAKGRRVTRRLVAEGAVEEARFGNDVVLAVPRARTFGDALLRSAP